MQQEGLKGAPHVVSPEEGQMGGSQGKPGLRASLFCFGALALHKCEAEVGFSQRLLMLSIVEPSPRPSAPFLKTQIKGYTEFPSYDRDRTEGISNSPWLCREQTGNASLASIVDQCVSSPQASRVTCSYSLRAYSLEKAGLKWLCDLTLSLLCSPSLS